MKNFHLVLLISLFSFSVHSQTPVTNYPESGFIAAFPVKPIIEKKELDHQVGKIEMVTYESEGEDYMILLSENKYPPAIIEKGGTVFFKGVIDGAKKGAIKNLEGQLGAPFKKNTDEDFLFNEKYTANRTSGTISEIEIKTICIIKGNQMFFMMFMGNTESESIDSFVKSFHFIENY
jgi:hypothetical protein